MAEAELDYYAVLQVDRNADAAEIRKSYQRLVRQCHPDKLPVGLSESEQRRTKELFHQISRAYEVLSNPLLRIEYDRKANAQYLTQQWPVTGTIDLEDMTFDSESAAYSTSCRCGGTYTVSEEELSTGVDTVCCSTCTLSIHILYQEVKDEEEEEERRT